jgi:predicted AAA+ superfamily ATPase
MRIRESLTGRASSVRLFPLTCAEALGLPFEELKSCVHVHKTTRATRSQFMRHLVNGGMPAIFAVHSLRERQVLMKDWLETSIYRDLGMIPGLRLDSELALNILKEIATLDIPSAGEIAKSLRTDLRRIRTHLEALETLFVIHRLNPIKQSFGKPLYFLVDVGFAKYFEASFERCIHTWLIQETLARMEWSENIKESIGYYRSAKGALTHLVVQKSKDSWDAFKILPKEGFNERDFFSLNSFKEKIPSPVNITLTALCSMFHKVDGVNCVPWEALI